MRFVRQRVAPSWRPQGQERTRHEAGGGVGDCVRVVARGCGHRRGDRQGHRRQDGIADNHDHDVDSAGLDVELVEFVDQFDLEFDLVLDNVVLHDEFVDHLFVDVDEHVAAGHEAHGPDHLSHRVRSTHSRAAAERRRAAASPVVVVTRRRERSRRSYARATRSKRSSDQ